MKLKTGFTLLELLVVIAIIGILASVVLGSLSSARESAIEAAIKQNISSVINQAALYYEKNGSYGDEIAPVASGVCNVTDGTLDHMFEPGVENGSGEIVAETLDIQAGTTALCGVGVNGQTYAVSVDYSINGVPTKWCVDSQGFKGSGDATQVAAGDDVVCSTP